MAAFDNCTLYWPLNEASGNRVDVVASEVLTDTNTVGSASDATHGTVAQFTSADSDKLTLSDMTSYNPGTGEGNGAYSLSYWFWQDNSTQSGIFTLSPGDHEAYLRTAPFKRWELTLRSELKTANQSDATDGVWIHVVISLTAEDESGDQRLTVYANNSVVINDMLLSLTAAAEDVTEFTLGYDGTRYSDARMMKVGFWSGTAIGATQVSELYNSGNPPTHPSEGGGASSPKQASSLNLGLKGLGL